MESKVVAWEELDRRKETGKMMYLYYNFKNKKILYTKNLSLSNWLLDYCYHEPPINEIFLRNSMLGEREGFRREFLSPGKRFHLVLKTG